MAKRKTKQVKSFGGTKHLGNVVEQDAKDAPVKDVNYDVQDLEVQSKTNLEQDQGGGGAAIIRCFEFGINYQTFNEVRPTKQDLFNAHYKGIEMALWRDGLKVIPEVNPRIVINSSKGTYSIFVGANPMKGHILREQPRTLADQLRSEESYG